MKKLNRKNLGLEEKLPIKIVQFGEGNFLRAFICEMCQRETTIGQFDATGDISPAKENFNRLLDYV